MQKDHHAFARSTDRTAAKIVHPEGTSHKRWVPHPPSTEDGAPRARGTFQIARACAIAALLASASGCDSLTHLTTTLGGTNAGDRGTVQVIIINNTPHRAVFTVGTFDDMDRFSEPVFEQFGVKDREQNLDGDSTSPILSLSCGRVFSVGGKRMLDLIARNLPDETTIDEATIEGVKFYELPTDATADPVLIGEAPSLEALIGEDFGCGSIIVLHCEFDDAAPQTSFRVDFRVIPAQSAR